jgi:hypothetical protein
MTAPIRAIDEIHEQNIKMDLSVHIATAIPLCDLENTLLKLVLAMSNGKDTAVNQTVKHSMTLQTPLFNAPEDLAFGFDSATSACLLTKG